MNLVIQGHILNRDTFERDEFLDQPKTVAQFNKVMRKVTKAIEDNPELTVTIMIRAAK